jgi:alcohol dehydrogenase (cytochrome c)
MLLPGHTPDEDGNKTCPDLGGGTNFMSPSFDPTTRLFFVTARETCAMYYAYDQKFKPGEQYTGGGHDRGRAIRRTSARCARSIRSPAR